MQTLLLTPNQQTVSLRPHQVKAKTELYNCLREGEKRIMIVAPCGWGKTYFTASVLKDAAIAKGRRCLFVVPFRTLVEQARESFESMGIVPGILAGGYKEDRTSPVQIATIQTIGGSRDISWFDYSVVILDETHITAFSTWFKQQFPLLKAGEELLGPSCLDDELSEIGIHQVIHGNTTWTEVKSRWQEIKENATDKQRAAYYTIQKYREILSVPKPPNNKILIGLTGSPYRLSKRESMADAFQAQVTAETPGEMVGLGMLVGCTYYTVKGADLSGVHISGGDFVENEISELCRDPEVVKSAVDNYLKICPDRLFINFAVDVQHAKMLTQEFTDRGINAHIITAETPDHTRHKLFNELRNGEIQGLISVGCLSVGFDVPNISCVILSRPTLSISLYIQQVGRGMRLAPDKENCIVLDQSGNIKRFGFIESIEYPELDDNTITAKPAPVKDCPNCGRVLDVFAQVCPCGHVFESEGTGKEKVRPVGEMEIIVAPQDRRIYDFYRQKLWDAFDKEYSPEWATMKVKDNFGRYPLQVWARGAVSESPMGKLFVTKERYIKYLKGIVDKKQSDPELSEDKKARYNDKWIQRHFYNEFGVKYEPPSSGNS